MRRERIELMKARDDGVDWTPEGIESVRIGLIQLRDDALDRGAMSWAVLLTHSVAYLAELKEIIKEDEKEDEPSPTRYMPSEVSEPESGLRDPE